MRDMELNTIGVILSSYREQNNIIAKKICDGLCSFSTMTRIERNERIADSLLSELLLQRIGKNVAQFELIVDKEDYEFWKCRQIIEKSFKKKEYEEVKKTIENYRKMITSEQVLHEQFCMFYEMQMYADSESDDRNQMLEMCRKILNISKPDFEMKKKQFYTEIEIMTILYMVQINNCNEEEILLDMLEFIEDKWEQRKKEEIGVKIILQLLNITNDSLKRKLQYIDKAISFISDGRGIHYLDELHYKKAKILYQMYRDDLNDEVLRTIKMECLMAYSVGSVTENYDLVKKVICFGEEKLLWQVTKLEM